MFGSLLATVVNVVTAPIAVVQDVVTLGGVLDDKDKSYTQKHIEKTIQDIKDIEKGN
jgi:hypothetical protein